MGVERQPKGDPVPRPYLDRKGQQRLNAKGEGWRLRFSTTAGQRVDAVYYGTYEQAVRELDRLRDLTDEGQQVPSRARVKRLGVWLDEWLKDYQQRTDLQPTTLREHESNMRLYIRPWIAKPHGKGRDKAPPLKDKRLAAVTAEDIEQLVNGFTLVSGSDPSVSMRRSVRKTLSLAFADAITAGYVRKNPAGDVRWDLEPLERFVPTRAELEATLDILRDLPSEVGPRNGPKTRTGPPRPWLADILTIGAWTGARPAELLAVKTSAVHTARRSITFETQATVAGGRLRETDRMKTKSSKRTVPILPDAEAAVLAQLVRAKDLGSDYLCVGAGRRASRLTGKGTRKTVKSPAAVGYSMLAGELREACRRAVEAGVLREPWSPGVTRHFFVSALLSSGVSEQQVAAWAGHASVRMVKEVYGTAREAGDLSAVADEVGALLDRHYAHKVDVGKTYAKVRSEVKKKAAERAAEHPERTAYIAEQRAMRRNRADD